MANIALYRKYRPFNFKNLVGQDHIKNTLTNAFKSDNPSHAYLFCGPRGTGKTTTARLIAKALNCENLQEGYEPCNECNFCTSINDANLIDLIEIDAASNRGIDEIRDLKEKINFAPTRAKTKVYIIDEVHMMTKEAFNALLKTLEEPPSYVYFILATTEVHKIPETIISRCQRFDFKRIDEKALMSRLGYIAQLENIKAEDKALEAISRHVEGGLRDAIQLLEQLTVDGKLSFDHVQDILGVSDFETLDKLFDALIANDTDAGLKMIQDIYSQGYSLLQFCHEFIDIVRKKLLEAVSDNNDAVIIKYLKIIETFQVARDRLKYYSIPQLPLEIAVIESTKNMVEVVEEQAPVAKSKPVKAPAVADPAPAPAAAPVSTEAPAAADPAPEPAAPAEDNEPTEKTPLTISYVKEKWPRITERVDIPACKRSLMDGEISKVDGADVTIDFRSNFHRNKVMEHENRIEIEKIFEEVFGVPVKLLGQVKEIEIDSTITEDSSEREHKGIEEDSTDDVLEVFGGELIEDED
ncbi:DNA polymerase III subunit gamma/tau [Candidatus Peregrinibacteria bacterium]|jgi:DNA polymerase III subunit gamma/tau|nr:DNA polymerase III subunit gamma/tau [Candidatus Peregrinibacteria bacterium]MBT4147990.1 DNA polymerase III subunit gamma/tau [Candidatus Peregrinibacteria bacterium]MBT4456239.1 DNA polymerase III subunit gamma/tau [Candidatus Peregrinibacteria bacterium]